MPDLSVTTGSVNKWIVWPLNAGCTHENKYPLYCAHFQAPGHEDHIVGWGCHGPELEGDCDLWAHWEGPGCHWCTGPGDEWAVSGG